jgi:L-ribulose-5-phosphate 3-epimerase
MRRRDFLGLAATVALAGTSGMAGAIEPQGARRTPVRVGRPMELGLVISPFRAPEETIKRVHDLGLSTCFLSLDGYIGKFTPELATQMRGLLDKYGVKATAVEVVGPGKLVWDFMQGPSTGFALP